MKRVKRQWPFLQSLLNTAQHNVRREMLQYANKDQINALSEVVLNALQHNIPLKPDAVARLRKHKRVLRKLADRHINFTTRKKVLSSQRGGAFWNSLKHICHYLT